MPADSCRKAIFAVVRSRSAAAAFIEQVHVDGATPAKRLAACFVEIDARNIRPVVHPFGDEHVVRCRSVFGEEAGEAAQRAVKAIKDAVADCLATGAKDARVVALAEWPAESLRYLSGSSTVGSEDRPADDETPLPAGARLTTLDDRPLLIAPLDALPADHVLHGLLPADQCYQLDAQYLQLTGRPALCLGPQEKRPAWAGGGTSNPKWVATELVKAYTLGTARRQRQVKTEQIRLDRIDKLNELLRFRSTRLGQRIREDAEIERMREAGLIPAGAELPTPPSIRESPRDEGWDGFYAVLARENPQPPVEDLDESEE